MKFADEASHTPARNKADQALLDNLQATVETIASVTGRVVELPDFCPWPRPDVQYKREDWVQLPSGSWNGW